MLIQSIRILSWLLEIGEPESNCVTLVKILYISMTVIYLLIVPAINHDLSHPLIDPMQEIRMIFMSFFFKIQIFKT